MSAGVGVTAVEVGAGPDVTAVGVANASGVMRAEFESNVAIVGPTVVPGGTGVGIELCRACRVGDKGGMGEGDGTAVGIGEGASKLTVDGPGVGVDVATQPTATETIATITRPRRHVFPLSLS